MYGYWDVNEKYRKKFVCKWYEKYKQYLKINPIELRIQHANNEYARNHVNDWAHIPTKPVLRAASVRDPKIKLSLVNQNRQLLDRGEKFTSNVYTDATHKITNILVDRSGLQQ